MNHKFKHVAVLKGGFSKEREVSLRSGAAIANGLRQNGYEIEEIDITGTDFSIPPGVEAAFIALHGDFGEDGRIQRILEERQIPYTGAGSEASWLAFAKDRTKEILVRRGIATPSYEILSRQQQGRKKSLPVVVKPTRQGSSFGVHLVFDENTWNDSLADALSYNGEVLVEAYIDGRELTVGIVDHEILPVIEIQAPAGNYDYRAKYTKGLTEYLVPAPIEKQTAQLSQQLAWDTYCALNCRGLGRVDLRLAPDGKLYVLELNTIPGFTETSLLPKAAKAAGYSFPALCERIMETAAL